MPTREVELRGSKIREIRCEPRPKGRERFELGVESISDDGTDKPRHGPSNVLVDVYAGIYIFVLRRTVVQNSTSLQTLDHPLIVAGAVIVRDA